MHIVQNNAFAAQPTFIAAFANAQLRAERSYFPQHIICDEEQGFFAIDEGDYPMLPPAILSRIVHTVAGQLDDSF